MTPPADRDLDEIDKGVLDRLQRGVPLIHRPFQQMARDIGLDEAEFLNHTKRLTQRKIVRRVAPILDVRALGRPTTLVAASVPEDRVDDVGAILSDYPGVSHSYRRYASSGDAPYNLWLTLSARDKQEMAAVLAQMEQDADVKLLSLSARRIFKIGVRFDIR